MTQAFARVLTGLASSWSSLFRPTSFDTGAARVAAVDLSEVAPTGSAEADRQTAVFYMVARQFLTRDWWSAPEDIGRVPAAYRSWHARRAREMREAPKRLAYDEFHRTAQAPAVRAQVERDVREARKLGVRLVLASQRIEDFGESLVELANRYWILGAGGEAGEMERLSATFGLSETVADAVRTRLTGPGRAGAPALLIASDARGRFEQLVLNAPGTGGALGAHDEPGRRGAAAPGGAEAPAVGGAGRARAAVSGGNGAGGNRRGGSARRTRRGRPPRRGGRGPGACEEGEGRKAGTA